MSAILVTGGCGYVGSQLIRTLAELAPGREVRILDNLHRDTYRALMDLPEGATYRFLHGDVLDRAMLGRALIGVDTVFHLAGIVRTPMTFENPAWMRQVNQWGTQGVGEAALAEGVKRFVFASSTVVYGPGGPHDESVTPRPVGPYAESKAGAEHALASLAARGLDVRVVRLGMAYGYAPALRLDGVTNRLVFQAATGRPVTVYGSGVQRRPLIHVEDAARALVHVAGLEPLGKATFNAVSANPTILELAESIVKSHPGAELRFTDQDAQTHLSFEVDGSALRATGWRPTVDHGAAIGALLTRFGGLAGNDRS